MVVPDATWVRMIGWSVRLPVSPTTNVRTVPCRCSRPITAVLPLPHGPGPWTRAFRLALCMFRAAPPMYVSSASTWPCSLASNDPTCIAMRMRCCMNHAVFWVTPNVRCTS